MEPGMMLSGCILDSKTTSLATSRKLKFMLQVTQLKLQFLVLTMIFFKNPRFTIAKNVTYFSLVQIPVKVDILIQFLYSSKNEKLQPLKCTQI